ncbi:MAG: acetyltransferase [Gammaproteobacteria bacterium]
MPEGEPVYILGAGGHAKVVASTLLAAGYRGAGFFDDDAGKWGQTVLGLPVLGDLSQALRIEGGMAAVIGIGDNKRRREIATTYTNIKWLSIIHPRTYVHPTVRLGRGTVIFAGAVIQPDARIGEHCIVNTLASVDHDCNIGAFVHIAPGAHLAGNVLVGEGVLIGLGSSVMPHVSIGARTVVGAGSAVVGNLPPDVIATGVPARILKTRQHA